MADVRLHNALATATQAGRGEPSRAKRYTRNHEVDKTKSRSLFLAMLANLGWPFCWGMLIWLGFYSLLRQGYIESQLLHRYFAGHPVEYIEAAMFFVGIAALVIKLVTVARQHLDLGRVSLDAVPGGGQPIEECGSLLERLEELPRRIRHSLLAERLHHALEHVRRKGSADGLDDHLK